MIGHLNVGPDMSFGKKEFQLMNQSGWSTDLIVGPLVDRFDAGSSQFRYN